MFKFRKLYLGALLATGTLIAVGFSQNARAQGVLEDCADDIMTYCENVEPGQGRIISCLYAYEDKISEQCYAATIDFHDAMDFVFATIREALATCATDIETFCAETEFGGGRILTCLSENQSDIAPECKQVVDGFKLGFSVAE
jgi:hypothetical protein